MELFDKAIKEGPETYIIYQGANTRTVVSIYIGLEIKNKKIK